MKVLDRGARQRVLLLAVLVIHFNLQQAIIQVISVRQRLISLQS